MIATLLFNNQEASRFRSPIAFNESHLLNGNDFQLFIAQFHDANGNTRNVAIDGIVEAHGNRAEDISLCLSRAMRTMSIIQPQVPLVANNMAIQLLRRNTSHILCMYHQISKCIRDLLTNAVRFNHQVLNYAAFVTRAIAVLNVPNLEAVLRGLTLVVSSKELHYGTFLRLAESNLFNIVLLLLPGNPISQLLSTLGRVHNLMNRQLSP